MMLSGISEAMGVNEIEQPGLPRTVSFSTESPCLSKLPSNPGKPGYLVTLYRVKS